MSILFFLYCTLFSLVSALPTTSPVSLDVWRPQITYPDANTIWFTNNIYTVAWDTTGKPEQVTNPIGKVFLRHDGVTQSTPIAQGFALTDGKVDVTIPDTIQSATDWTVVLMGDSGNFSPPFAIFAL